MELQPDSLIDLQLHTTNSDGAWTPVQMLDYLAANDFALAAVTDHDRLDTVASVVQLGIERGIAILPAVEISCVLDDLMVDLLCYNVPLGPSPLLTFANNLLDAQRANLREVVATLEQRGFSFPHAAQALPNLNGEMHMVSHLLTLMEAHGYTDQMRSAIRATNYRMIMAEIPDVVEAAHRSGAIAILAHPGRTDGFFTFTQPTLDRLRALAPIDGLEIIHPHHTPDQIAFFQSYARQHNLLTSTGSDSHGPPGHLPIKHHAQLSQRLLERCGITFP